MKYKVKLSLDTTLNEINKMGFRVQRGGAYLFNQTVGEAFVTISNNYELGVTPQHFYNVIAEKFLETGCFYKEEVK